VAEYREFTVSEFPVISIKMRKKEENER